MSRIALFAALGCVLAGCLFKPERPTPGTGDGGPDGDWLAGYQHRKRLEVTTAAGATLTDFPVAIVLAADADLAAHAGGDDFVVTAADGLEVLDSELVAYAAGGDLELWVRVPALPATATALYLYYDGPAHASAASTWSPRFAGVWHLGATADSTPHGNDLAVTDGAPGTAPGIVGGARSLDGDDGLGGGDPGDGSLDFAGSFTYSLWVFQQSPLGAFDMPFYKGGPSAQEPGYCLLLGTGQWNAKIHDGTNLADPGFGDVATLGNRWTHLAVVIDRGAQTMTTFTDGVEVEQRSLAAIGSLVTGEPLAIGRGTDGAYAGLVDEVRIYGDAIEPAWLVAEHANHTAAGFLAVGAEEAR